VSLETVRTYVDAAKRIVAGMTALLHLYWASSGAWSQQRVVHVGLFMCLAFLMYPTTAAKSGTRAWIGFAVDLLLFAATVVAFGYTILDYDDLLVRSGDINARDFAAGLAITLLLLEATRRSIGKPIMILACLFLVYDYFGPHFPGLLGHRGYSLVDIIDLMYATSDGIFGIPVGVMASYVALFMIFGALLELYGAGEFFMKLSLALAGRYTGGPAKVAVVSSMSLGMISGSAVANVVTTGTLTIPLMKRMKFAPHVAGAVESVASTGGMLMPPIMGAAAFVLADIVGIPYTTLVVAAIIPGVLYYVSIFAVVHFYSTKHGLKGLDRSEIPLARTVLKDGAILFVPLIVLMYELFTGRTPGHAVFWAIVATVVVGSLTKKTRRTPRQIWDALVDGTLGTVSIALCCACAGIIIGAVAHSGLSLKFGSLLLGFSGGSLILVLVLTMLICLVFGMGLPATASYLTTAVLAVPALAALEVPKLAAHLFVFYFSNLSAITPPVALAAFAAAGLAGSGSMHTAYHSTRFAVAAFVLPFMFIYQPALLLLDKPWTEALVAALICAAAFVMLAFGLIGVRKAALHRQWERIPAFAAVAGFLSFEPVYVAAAAMAAAVALYSGYRSIAAVPAT